MTTEPSKQRIKWYRSPVASEDLARLNQRSDWKGWVYSVGNLALLVFTGGLSWYAVGRFPLLVVLALLFLHGTFYAFLVNGFHELCHQSVFRTRYLNNVFLYIYSFLGWLNPVFFWASHQEHHKYTLHPPDDLEVVLPVKLTLKSYLGFAFINPVGLYNRLVSVTRLSFGKVDGEWANLLFPANESEKRRALFNWARILLIGHALIVVVSLALGLWMIPIIITLAPFYGAGFQYLFNEAQHIGLSDNVSDYRLNTRTIILNPFVGFLYWNMNYHSRLPLPPSTAAYFRTTVIALTTTHTHLCSGYYELSNRAEWNQQGSCSPKLRGRINRCPYLKEQNRSNAAPVFISNIIS